MRSSLTKVVLDRLRNFESPNVTYLPEDDSSPIIWERARGMKVWDIDGNEYLDLTAAFGVAATGHASPPVVRAGQRQMRRLIHAMGDVHPHALKAELAERLSKLTFGRWQSNSACQVEKIGKTIFCNSGFETIEAALKTACQATGKRRIISFEGAYHGLGYGSLVATHRDHFRGNFGKQIPNFGHRLQFPLEKKELEKLKKELASLLEIGDVGAVLVEPIQMRGGVNVPFPGFLKLLRDECNRRKVILIFDEIFTGFGRTGAWFACEHEGVVPDLICLGKALTGGFPLSAMVGRADLMDAAWPPSKGEAIHTSTFLGHPIGCAMALAQINVLEKKALIKRSATLENDFKELWKRQFHYDSDELHFRGKGLLLGIELRTQFGEANTKLTLQLVKDLLASGFIVLPTGEFGNVIGLTPPLIIQKSQINHFVNCFFKLYKLHKRDSQTS